MSAEMNKAKENFINRVIHKDGTIIISDDEDSLDGSEVHDEKKKSPSLLMSFHRHPCSMNDSVTELKKLTTQSSPEKGDHSNFIVQDPCSSNAEPGDTHPFKNVKKRGFFKWNGKTGNKDSEKTLKQRKIWKPLKQEKDDSLIETQQFTIESRSIIKQKLKNETVVDSAQHDIKIAGVSVKFPVKPYSCQIAVMNMLIQGCAKKQNCLLESPTGSGKTLALLCGALAWQSHYEKEVAEKKLTSDCEEEGDEPVNTQDSCSSMFFKEAPLSARWYEPDPISSCESTSSTKDNEFSKSLTVPKVYYGSRTHRQIGQVVSELKKTAYRDKRMTILSSREFTCIQNTDRNKTDLCNDLLDPLKKRGCPFYTDNNKRTIGTFDSLESHNFETPWDIEDLVDLGKANSACPYFAARNLMASAEIIFCPYNYLIDPEIRDSMQIKLDGAIIILDEAHNIEDISREVGSFSFKEDHLRNAAQECDSLSRKKDMGYYIEIHNFFTKLCSFMRSMKLNRVNENTNDESSAAWTSKELIELFDMHGLSNDYFPSFLTAAKAAIMDFNSSKEEVKQNFYRPVIGFHTKRLLEQLCLALQMINSQAFSSDYRACITETSVKDDTEAEANVWMSTVRVRMKRVRTLQFTCMNSAVTFRQLANLSRSVILASGTLAPTSSFQSELGIKFTHVLNSNHVISSNQVYIRGISKGPTDVVLKANYTNVNSWTFQDELGRVLLDVCQAVPHGILCFFSSYNMMNKQVNRWKENGHWDKMKQVKLIFLEPRFNSELESVMREYKEFIKDTATAPLNGVNGALLLAVFRGKVAEGIDFSDNEARCVVAIGIPYAVRRDPMIDMKFTYNDLNHSKGLLKGGEWYAVQAFRALNQALGRCIRHKNDWGIVLMVDERFLSNSTQAYLPKWVRAMWTNRVDYNLQTELKQFVAKHINHNS
ncbi:Fanconi anemia group J protein homolog isoform X2 [Cephus cinctus]|nr:Fanconi anemia group J protein homolog isoform X2 [Cephus cinctus]